MPTSLPLAGLRVARGLLQGLTTLADRAPDRDVMPAADSRHPLQPAAIRVERTTAGGDTGSTQTAVTMWFGRGPALPAPGSPAVRGALRVGAGVLGAAALAALTTVAAQREARLTPSPRVRRLATPAIPSAPVPGTGAQPLNGEAGPGR